MGIVDYNPGVKDYALPKLYENLKTCQKYVDVVFISDRDHDPFKTKCYPMKQSNWSEDILFHTRNYIRFLAIRGNYDAFIWQGSDCYYDSEIDFLLFIANAVESNFKAIGALTSARTNSYLPVARRFVNIKVRGQQETISEDELNSGECIEAGFPGADALFVKKDLFGESWFNWKNFKPWYELRDENPHSLCVEEFWCLKVIEKYGNVIGLDTSTKMWHASEDGYARRWPGQIKRIEDLHFE